MRAVRAGFWRICGLWCRAAPIHRGKSDCPLLNDPGAPTVRLTRGDFLGTVSENPEVIELKTDPMDPLATYQQNPPVRLRNDTSPFVMSQIRVENRGKTYKENPAIMSREVSEGNWKVSQVYVSDGFEEILWGHRPWLARIML